jgi:hypothetical protein
MTEVYLHMVSQTKSQRFISCYYQLKKLIGILLSRHLLLYAVQEHGKGRLR